MTLGAFISSSFAGPIAKFMGRKDAIWAASVLCAIANTIMMASTNIAAIYVGRILIGLANGMFMTFSQLYIQVRPRYLPSFVSSSRDLPLILGTSRRSLSQPGIEA